MFGDFHGLCAFKGLVLLAFILNCRRVGPLYVCCFGFTGALVLSFSFVVSSIFDFLWVIVYIILFVWILDCFVFRLVVVLEIWGLDHKVFGFECFIWGWV